MSIIGKALSLSMMPAFFMYTLISLSAPLSARAESRITPYAPESVESLPLEDELRPRPPEPPSTGGSKWWKLLLGLLVLGAVATGASGGGNGGNGDNGGNGGNDGNDGNVGGAADTGGATASW